MGGGWKILLLHCSTVSSPPWCPLLPSRARAGGLPQPAPKPEPEAEGETSAESGDYAAQFQAKFFGT